MLAIKLGLLARYCEVATWEIVMERSNLDLLCRLSPDLLLLLRLVTFCNWYKFLLDAQRYQWSICQYNLNTSDNGSNAGSSIGMLIYCKYNFKYFALFSHVLLFHGPFWMNRKCVSDCNWHGQSSMVMEWDRICSSKVTPILKLHLLTTHPGVLSCR